MEVAMKNIRKDEGCLVRKPGSRVRKMLVSMILMMAMATSLYGQVTGIHLRFDRRAVKRHTIPFEMVNNLIIVPGFINGSDTLRFIVDTGVGNTLITSLSGIEKISFNFARELTIYGFGTGDEIKAYHSYGNVLKLPGVVGYNHNVIILREELEHLSQSLGLNVHGILGYDLFNSFVVDIDYIKGNLVLYEPEYYNKRIRNARIRKYQVVPLEIERQKPYIYASVKDQNNQDLRLRLLVDTGASHALSLFESEENGIEVPAASLYTFLGLGLSGDVYGSISRINRLDLGTYSLAEPIVTFPEIAEDIRMFETLRRHGTIGSDVLKRFHLTFDYFKREVIFRPNGNYRREFQYNLSGLEVATPYPGLPYFRISKVREGSPAWNAGLSEGDDLMSINGIRTSELTLARLTEILQSKPGRRVRLGVMRDKDMYSTRIVLEDPLR
jgi:hypothetical protein